MKVRRRLFNILPVALLGLLGVFLPFHGYASSLATELGNYGKLIKNDSREYELTYKVKKADNLWKIARKMGISVHELIRDNKIHSPDMIFPGDRLTLPIDKDLPVRFEVVKLETSDRDIKVIYPNKHDVMAPLVPTAYFPTENSNDLNYKFRVSVTFDPSITFFQWLVAQGYNEKSTSKTFHNSPTSPKPLNLSGASTFAVYFPEGEGIRIGKFSPYHLVSDLASPPPKSV